MKTLTKTKKISMAIYNLAKGKKWVLRGDEYDGLEWDDEGLPPTKEAVEAEITRIELDEWKMYREYPEIGEQLDMLWHELNQNGTITNEGNWFNKIKSIKEINNNI